MEGERAYNLKAAVNSSPPGFEYDFLAEVHYYCWIQINLVHTNIFNFVANPTSLSFDIAHQLLGTILCSSVNVDEGDTDTPLTIFLACTPRRPTQISRDTWRQGIKLVEFVTFVELSILKQTVKDGLP